VARMTRARALILTPDQLFQNSSTVLKTLGAASLFSRPSPSPFNLLLGALKRHGRTLPSRAQGALSGRLKRRGGKGIAAHELRCRKRRGSAGRDPAIASAIAEPVVPTGLKATARSAGSTCGRLRRCCPMSRATAGGHIGARGIDRGGSDDADRADCRAPHDRFRFTAQGIALIDRYFLVMIGVAAVLALARARLLLPRHDDRRAHRRRPPRRRVRARDLAPALLRRGQDRRSHLAAHRRHEPRSRRPLVFGVGGAAHLVLFVGASVMMVVTSPALSLRPCGDPDHRACRFMPSPRRTPPLALCPGYACGSVSLCRRADRRGCACCKLSPTSRSASATFASSGACI